MFPFKTIVLIKGLLEIGFMIKEIWIFLKECVHSFVVMVMFLKLGLLKRYVVQPFFRLC